MQTSNWEQTSNWTPRLFESIEPSFEAGFKPFSLITCSLLRCHIDTLPIVMVTSRDKQHHLTTEQQDQNTQENWVPPCELKLEVKKKRIFYKLSTPLLITHGHSNILNNWFQLQSCEHIQEWIVVLLTTLWAPTNLTIHPHTVHKHYLLNLIVAMTTYGYCIHLLLGLAGPQTKLTLPCVVVDRITSSSSHLL